jgi:hypothetical protein
MNVFSRIVVGALVLIYLVLCCALASAQETVFNVPSGDVLDRGKIYGELDLPYNPGTSGAGFTPRVVAGIGHDIEIGLNINGIAVPGSLQTTPTPTLKWRPYNDARRGWALFVGDDLFIPAQNRTYDIGNYLYLELTKTWKTKTRATVGAYHFTPGVVATRQGAGGQFAIEQPFGPRITLAADWYTGNDALGYAAPGIIVKINSKLTAYGSYEIGNRGVSTGHSQFLFELGWNLN